MSFSLNSRIVDLVAPGARQGNACGRPPKTLENADFSAERRRLLLAALAAGLAAPAAAQVDSLPLAGLQRWGKGEFRRLGFPIYEATLWAGDDPQRPPLALSLEYRRPLSGSVIAEASVKEMRQLGADEAALQRWGEQMGKLFPDVKAGDRILGVHWSGRASFLHNGQWLGEIADAEFARRFFAIWLDPKSSAPALRAALLTRPAA